MAIAMMKRCPLGSQRRHKSKPDGFAITIEHYKFLRLVKRMLASLNCPRSLTVWLLLQSKEYGQLLDLSCHPTDYNSPLDFRDAYCATELLSKAKFLKTGINTEEVALKKFETMELHNRESNKRILSVLRTDRVEYDQQSRILATALTSMSFKIASVLKEFDPTDWLQWCDWGPGATLSVSRRHASRYNKYRDDLDTTQACLDLMTPCFHAGFPLWAAAHGMHSRADRSLAPMRVVRGNRVVTVPKNAKTDRVICIEPGINLFLQKGIGKMIRYRLKRVGIDLDTQSRNQQLAKVAVSRGLATVDFSSASDTISKRLVEAILPPVWFTVLNSLRSRSSEQGRSWEKFSTMGNGFTFELESLIFWAAAIHACEVVDCPVDDVSVFGDDVVIPIQAYETFKEVVILLGFIINTEKTCVDNVFRESCGVHYYERYDTKPLYIRDIPTDLNGLFKLANGIRGLGHRFNDGCGCDLRFRNSWVHVVDWIPKELRFFGPVHLGDSVLHGNFDEATPSRAEHGYEGWVINAQTNVSHFSRPRCGNAWLLSKLGVPGPDTSSSELSQAALRQPFGFSGWKVREAIGVQGLIQRTGVLRSKTQTVVVSQWYDMGPWCSVY